MSGQFINHFGTVRLRVTGTGTLEMKLIGLDASEQILTDVTMASSTNKFPNVLSNFSQQKAQLEIKTSEIDEEFLIKEIHIYIRPIFTSFPQ